MNNITNIKSKRICPFIFAVVLAICSISIMPLITYADSLIAISNSNLSVDVDSTVTLYLTGNSTDAISWGSSNTDAAVIDSSTTRKAVVRGVGKGESNITATDENGNTATCKVSVKVPAFIINSDLLMIVEESNYIYVEAGEAVDWKSSNNDIVSIWNSDSYHAEIKAESVGSVIITATDAYGSESKCTIRVRQERFDVTLGAVYDSAGYDCDSADFSRYYLEQHQDGWWDNDYNYHDSYYYYDSLLYYEVHVNDGNISKCTSSNNSVASVSKVDGTYRIYPKGVGTATITVTNPYGEVEKFNCRVTLNYFIEKESIYPEGDELQTSKYYSYKDLKYGSGKLTGTTYNNANVTATINGKTYSGKADSSGYYCLSVPKYIKINTGITIKASQYGTTKSVNRKVINNKPTGTLNYKVNEKNIKVTIKNIHKGDYIKLKVGKKTYTKKIHKDKKKLKYTVKTKKLKKGTKVKITVYNKFKQKLKSKTFKIR